MAGGPVPDPKAGGLMALVSTALLGRPVGGRTHTSGWMLVRRNLLVYRKSWLVFLTGFLEPVLYLFSIGIGVGQLVHGFDVNGHLVPYAAFVAPPVWVPPGTSTLPASSLISGMKSGFG